MDKNNVNISIIIRTFNEEKYLDELLVSISNQEAKASSIEVIIVDSGSTDDTLNIAKTHGCRILHINKRNFTFGKSLNIGCEAARGNILVFVSGHCVPVSSLWLQQLTIPLVEDRAEYIYGRQKGRDTTKFSENQVFEKYYSDKSYIPQRGFFCNNANSALKKECWDEIRFNEVLTGLEDLHLAKMMVKKGHRIAYVAEAAVFHIHDESYRQVRIRFEREALALQKIMPEVHISFTHFMRYFLSGVLHDMKIARKQHTIKENLKEIIAFRFSQFWGGYRGNHEHRRLSAKRREEYFYPVIIRRAINGTKTSRTTTTKSA